MIDETHMRPLMFLVVLIGILAVVDGVADHGRYGKVFWAEVNDRGRALNREVRDWVGEFAP